MVCTGWHHPHDAGFEEHEMQDLMEAPTEILEGSVRDQVVTGLLCLQVCPDEAMCKAVTIKSQLQWRPQEVRDARSMEHCSGEP